MIALLLIWLSLWFYSLFIWYKEFGGFKRPFGLSIGICVVALFGAPQCAIAWTIGYFLSRFKK